jgi:hypothetical protein
MLTARRVVSDTLRDLLDDEWTPEIAQAWDTLPRGYRRMRRRSGPTLCAAPTLAAAISRLIAD